MESFLRSADSFDLALRRGNFFDQALDECALQRMDGEGTCELSFEPIVAADELSQIEANGCHGNSWTCIALCHGRHSSRRSPAATSRERGPAFADRGRVVRNDRGADAA